MTTVVINTVNNNNYNVQIPVRLSFFSKPLHNASQLENFSHGLEKSNFLFYIYP